MVFLIFYIIFSFFLFSSSFFFFVFLNICVDQILEGLFKLAGNKNEELQFTVGEVLSCLGAGEHSFGM